jgi:hypothetical protein
MLLVAPPERAVGSAVGIVALVTRGAELVAATAAAASIVGGRWATAGRGASSPCDLTEEVWATQEQRRSALTWERHPLTMR